MGRPNRRKKLFFIDDNQLIQTKLAKHLHDEFEVVFANSPSEVVDKIAEHSLFDFCILDDSLPYYDRSITDPLYEKLVQNIKGGAKNIVVITNRGKEELKKQKGEFPGAAAILNKKYCPLEFKEKIIEFFHSDK